MFRQMVRFGLVGGVNTSIDLLVLNILLYINPFPTSLSYVFYKTIAFLCALCNSFFMNRRFTFQQKKSISKKEIARFALVSILGFVASVGIPSVLFILLRIHTELSAVLVANIGACVGIGASLLLNFIGYKYVVFK